jgi:hydrogenase nickel incorporation protein HypA/HybF
MHEMGIALQILNIVQQSLPPGELLRVKAIHLRVGKLTAIVPGSLTFCLEVVAKDSVAEGAEVVFNEVPVVVECQECHEETEIAEPPFACGKCGSGKVNVLSGREMIVESIEVEEAAPEVTPVNRD